MADPANAAGTNPGTIGERLAALHRHLAASVPQLDRIGCALYDRGEDLLKTFVNSTRGEALRGYEFHLADSPSLRELARSGRDRLLPDLPAALSPEHAHSAWVLQEGYLSSFTVPLQGPGGFLGFVFFDSRRPAPAPARRQPPRPDDLGRIALPARPPRLRRRGPRLLRPA